MAAMSRRTAWLLVMAASALSLAACPAAPPQQVPPSEASSYRAEEIPWDAAPLFKPTGWPTRYGDSRTE